MKNLKEMKIDELVKLYKIEENEEMRSLIRSEEHTSELQHQ